jgi:hypothetical protein
MSHIHSENKNHWEKELERESLKEAPMKNKFLWKNPLTHLHAIEFRGKINNFKIYSLLKI